VKALLEQYASYNLWADERLLQTVSSLSESQQKQLVPGSFPSLHHTLLHVFDASSVWWQRLKRNETVKWPSKDFKGSTTDLVKEILNQDRLWQAWVKKAEEASLIEVLHYETSRKEIFAQPVFELLLHLFNHGTYHRGQIVTTLRLLNVDTIPATDFIVFSRTKN
jgi:uncharacterized damage-inducible protein DinB